MGTVVFDLDGTLVDSSGDLIAAANRCFVNIGAGEILDTSVDAATALHGGRAMLRLGFQRIDGKVDEKEVDRQYPLLLAAYEENIDIHTTLYDGAMAAVENLCNDGYRVAICTNKPEYLARLLLERLGVLNAFGSLVGADTLPVRKPHPEPLREAVRRAGGIPERALLVGDTKTDRETSRAAGIPSVLVLFGPEGGAVNDLSPEATISCYAELPEVVNSLLN
ncbi:MAG: HAD-IA family hydrolase [Roseovarius sp.]|nr:HAD-IA family hydrolase [Roseovarius sp.]MCY4207321.1 HAD-IA family hydrolase [Roseovarius sp.]